MDHRLELNVSAFVHALCSNFPQLVSAASQIELRFLKISLVKNTYVLLYQCIEDMLIESMFQCEAMQDSIQRIWSLDQELYNRITYQST